MYQHELIWDRLFILGLGNSSWRNSIKEHYSADGDCSVVMELQIHSNPPLFGALLGLLESSVTSEWGPWFEIVLSTIHHCVTDDSNGVHAHKKRAWNSWRAWYSCQHGNFAPIVSNIKKSAVTFVTVISQKQHEFGEVPETPLYLLAMCTCSSYPKMSDDHSSPHTPLPLYFLTTCSIWHLTSCRNFLSSHSNFYGKRVGNTEWGCFVIVNWTLKGTSWTSLEYVKLIPGCNYCKMEMREIVISPDLRVLHRKRSGDFVVHHKAIYLQPSTCGCVNILHERGGCHQRTAVHQKQPFLVRG